VASDDCTTPAVVIDGYFGSLYARLRTQTTATGAWVCARLQPEGGAEYAGGKLTVDAASLVGNDTAYDRCSSQTDNVLPGGHPFRYGELNDTPYLLDDYANTGGEAWLCLQAGLGARVMLHGGGAPTFEQDPPALAGAPPARTPWPSKASADCENQPAAGRTRLMNAEIQGDHVWLDAWQSGSVVELCVRAQGVTDAGGVLTIPTSGPGVTPVVNWGSGPGPCSSTVFSDVPDGLYVKRSDPPTANPASVCVTYGSTSEWVTVGTSGGPSATLPTWTADS
jgi:hypothetical protein